MKFMKNDSGFSLIEVLVALTIFAIGLLALAGMQITGIKGNSTAQSVSAKVALADGVIEEFLAMDGSDPILTMASHSWYDDSVVTVDGTGDCTIQRSLLATTVSGMDLSHLEVVVSSNRGADVRKEIMKRRY